MFNPVKDGTFEYGISWSQVGEEGLRSNSFEKQVPTEAHPGRRAPDGHAMRVSSRRTYV